MAGWTGLWATSLVEIVPVHHRGTRGFLWCLPAQTFFPLWNNQGLLTLKDRYSNNTGSFPFMPAEVWPQSHKAKNIELFLVFWILKFWFQGSPTPPKQTWSNSGLCLQEWPKPKGDQWLDRLVTLIHPSPSLQWFSAQRISSAGCSLPNYWSSMDLPSKSLFHSPLELM